MCYGERMLPAFLFLDKLERFNELLMQLSEVKIKSFYLEYILEYIREACYSIYYKGENIFLCVQ